MAKVAARNASIGIDDSTGACRSMSGFTNNAVLTWSAETPEVTGFGDSTKQRMQDGIKDAEFKLDAFYDTGATATDAVLAGVLGASTRFVFGPTGSTSGSVMYTTCAILSNYEMKFGVNDSGQVSATLVNRSGSLTRGTF
jgi:hypothetical protein